MCALFGVIDYGRSLSTKQKTKIITALAQTCEARGKDATGIAYNSGGRLNIYKRPLAARKMRFRLPGNAYTVMGHTRMATQGDERINANNHPFRGITVDSEFALAHNGVICNDRELRQTHNLPTPQIETDSYIAVQLIEQAGWFNFASIAAMAEKLYGTFTFTLLDNTDNLYVVKGNNPLCLYHWPKSKLYLYASTEALLTEALSKLPNFTEKPQKIYLDQGDILRIDPQGSRNVEYFDTANLTRAVTYSRPVGIYNRFYIDELKSISHAFGYTPEDIDELIHEGITSEEIEDYFYGGDYLWTGAYSPSPSR